MIDDRETDHVPGTRVRVRTRFGWAITGEIQAAKGGGIRMFDPAMREIVRFDPGDVVEIELVDDAPAGRAR